MKFAPKIKPSLFGQEKMIGTPLLPTDLRQITIVPKLELRGFPYQTTNLGPFSSRRHSDFALWRVILASIPILPSPAAWQHNKGAEFVASESWIVIPSWDWMAVDWGNPAQGSFSSWWIFPLVFLNAALLVNLAKPYLPKVSGQTSMLGAKLFGKGKQIIP